MASMHEVKDPYRSLAASIVCQAVTDWRQLVGARVWLDKYSSPTKNFDELRAFFKSEWCEYLLAPTGLKARDMLEWLEKELREAMEKNAPPTTSHYTVRY